MVTYIPSNPEVQGVREREQPHLGQRFSTLGDCTPRGHLATSGECHSSCGWRPGMLLASYSAQARPCGKNRLTQPQTPTGPRTPEFEKAGEEKGQ